MAKKIEPQPLARVVAAIIENEGRVLVARRRKGIRSGGFWEFPGGKLEPGETPERGLERELAEELGLETRTGELLCSVVYRGRGLALELLAYRVLSFEGEPRLSDHDAVRWVEPSALDESAFTEPDRPVVRMLAARAKG